MYNTAFALCCVHACSQNSSCADMTRSSIMAAVVLALTHAALQPCEHNQDRATDCRGRLMPPVGEATTPLEGSSFHAGCSRPRRLSSSWPAMRCNRQNLHWPDWQASPHFVTSLHPSLICRLLMSRYHRQVRTGVFIIPKCFMLWCGRHPLQAAASCKLMTQS